MHTHHLGLRATLRIDLQRQHELLNSHKIFKNNGLRFWFKVLSPRFAPVLLFRLAYKSQTSGLGILARIFSMINVIFFGIEIATICRIGPGLFLPHTQGTVIGAVSIGKNAVIYQGVTLGAKDLDFTYSEERRPIVGNNVLIGAGAKILGGLTIGDNVSIAANAVVLNSVPDFAVAAGVPAKIVSILGIKQ